MHRKLEEAQSGGPTHTRGAQPTLTSLRYRKVGLLGVLRILLQQRQLMLMEKIFQRFHLRIAVRNY